MATELAANLRSAGTHELHATSSGELLAKFWSSLWPKLAAAAVVITVWQVVAWTGWKPADLLPGPLPVVRRLAQDLSSSDFELGIAITLRRALLGYGIAVALGIMTGLAIARFAPIRAGIGSLVLALQSMPSIAWFPFAILLFGPNEAAIFSVVILGATPAIATGLIDGVDNVEPLLIRVGRVMGARGLLLYRHVILPAALPSFVGGLKQGWAFAWRSLMAGEIIGVASHQLSIGLQFQSARNARDGRQLLALVIVVLLIGIAVDRLFGIADSAIRRRWGLGGEV
jgi:NitT/TauT family transport system permease protein